MVHEMTKERSHKKKKKKKDREKCLCMVPTGKGGSKIILGGKDMGTPP
jgi:hypothetical protein